MKKRLLYLSLLLLLIFPFEARSLCHDCSLWLYENKSGRVHTFLSKIRCSIKRFFTQRRCCCATCYKNNPNYRIRMVSCLKDGQAPGMKRCNRCGRHHICHVCGKRLCLPDCNDHIIPLKENSSIEEIRK